MKELKPGLIKIFFHLPSSLYSTRSSHCRPQQPKKHEQHKPTFRSKNRRNIPSELSLEWEHLFKLSLRDLDEKMNLVGQKRERKKKQNRQHNNAIIIHRNENEACFWKWPQITLCILSNVLTSISERFCLNFEQINIPPSPPPVISFLEYF